MTSQRGDDLTAGREAYARRAWSDAYEALVRAEAEAPLASADLEKLAWSAGFSGRDREMLEAQYRLHQLLLDEGRQLPAARAAFWAGYKLLSLQEVGQATAWMARAQRLAEAEGEACVVHGYLRLPQVHRALAAGDSDAAFAAASGALEIGLQYDEPDLIALARSLLGRTLLARGEIERGLATLDEAMLAMMSSQLLPVVTGLVYCAVIGNCQRVYAYERAREWTVALTRWCESQPQLVPFADACQIHRVEIKRLSGEWPEAFEIARQAATRLRPLTPEPAAEALYQQAEIHRLRGELDAAETTYRAAHELGREPQPGLALLRLSQGRVDAAESAIRRVMTGCRERLQRAGLLPAFIEILLAAEKLDEARAACEELEQIASSLSIELLGAIAAHARGMLLLSEGNANGALEPLRSAFAAWQRAGAPYLAARVRSSLARACRELGDEEGAKLETDAARGVFQQLGAASDLAKLEPASTAPVATAGNLTARELQVLRAVASGKTNRAIARELHLSEKTIDRHVSNIFTKLDVSSRAAATAYAYEHRLV